MRVCWRAKDHPRPTAAAEINPNMPPLAHAMCDEISHTVTHAAHSFRPNNHLTDISVSITEWVMTNYYEIVVQGHLDAGWESWFDGLSITNTADGTAVLAGQIGD